MLQLCGFGPPLGYMQELTNERMDGWSNESTSLSLSGSPFLSLSTISTFFKTLKKLFIDAFDIFGATAFPMIFC